MIIKRKAGSRVVLAGLMLSLSVAVFFLVPLSHQDRQQYRAAVNMEVQTMDLGYSRPPRSYSALIRRLPQVAHQKLFLPSAERISLDIKFLDYQKLLLDRETALQRGRLIAPSSVDIGIRYRGQFLKAKARLKGDLADHWRSDKRMSLRVSMRNGAMIKNFSKFSLHKPLCRQFPHDHISSEVTQRMGGVAAKHEYVSVVVNGVDWGVMDMEEHMSKELLEKQQQKESLIVRFGNEVKWIFPPPAETWGFRCLWRMSDPKLYVKVYGGAPSIESRQSRRIYTYITESIRQPSHAFLYDVDAYSRALMLAAVWNDGHVLETWNCRHYFNPYTLRLHPIPSDSIGPTSIAERGLFPRRRCDPLLNNETYRQVTATEQYRDSLERNFAHVTSCLSQVPEVTRTVQNHFPNDEAIDLSPVIDSNVQALSTHLRGYLAQSTTAVDARDHLCVARKADGVIEVYNLTFDNVSIVEVVVDGRPQAITSAIIDGGQSQARPIVIPPRGASRHNPGILRVAGAGAKEAEVAILATINGTTRAYDCGQILVEPQYTVYADPGWGGDPPPMPRSQLNLISDHVHARHFEDGRLDFYNLVTEPVVVQRICVDGKAIAIKPFVVPGYLYGDYTPKSIRSDLLGLYDGRLTVETSFADTVRVTQLDSTLISDSLVNPLLADTDEDLAFLERNGSGGWRVRKGDWDVDAPLVVSGSLDIGEGTTLRFAETAYLVVKGALSVTGTSKEPVAFMPQGRTWRGIYVVSAPKRSILSNVIITDTTATEDGLLALTGGVTFYRSDVEFNNVKLTGTSAEDALNIVHSAFELNEVEVDQAASDGIDFDFATGTVANSLFQNIGGDALDFSGSRVDLDGVRIQGVRDKAVSAGEASHVKVRDLVVSDCGVALASKDGSTIDGVGVRIDAFKLYAAMCFRKKNFYGKPVLTIDNLRVNGGEEKFFRQIGADMIINGVAIGASQRDIDALYRTGPMKK